MNGATFTFDHGGCVYLVIEPVRIRECKALAKADRIEAGRAKADMDWKDCDLVEIDPQKVSGASVVKGTRVQADAIVENYEGGSDVEEINENFPSVSIAKIRAILAYAEAHREQPQL